MAKEFKISRILIATIPLAFVLVGCGGSGGSVGSPTSITGTVVDGFIEGAYVFLDLNGNLEHDEGEPTSSATNASGQYKIDTSTLTSNQLANAVLVTHVPETAKDADDGGVTLAQAGKTGFTLMSPVSAYADSSGKVPISVDNALVSPLTTLVANEITFNGSTLSEAREKVKSDYGLNADPMVNFVTQNNNELQAKARTVATVLGTAKQSATGSNSISLKKQLEAVSTAVTAKSFDISQSNTLSTTLKNEITSLVQKTVQQIMPATVSESGSKYQKFIVVFKNDAIFNDVTSVISTILNELGFGIQTSEFKQVLKGFAVSIPSDKVDAFLKAMQNNPIVEFVEHDRILHAPPISQDTQLFATWGLDRIDQKELLLDSTYTTGGRTGANVNAYVVDTGILSTHTDFGNRVKTGYSSILNDASTTDCNGHGTHVAGIIGSVTYGVAKGVSLVPVRVLDCDGSGTLGSVIAGLDWVIQDAQLDTNKNKRAVINLSLGGSTSVSMDRAVQKIVESNIPVIVAAGNDNANACNTSPAREPVAITVGATTITDARASYSNYGNCIDIFAPGSAITSTWWTSSSNSATNTLSGTSMAAPFVAGVAALAFEMNTTATATEIGNLIKNQATANKVTNLGSGSNNLLLYSRLQPSDSVTTPTPIRNTVYVSNLTGSSTTSGAGWIATATVTVKDSNGNLQPGALVKGSFTLGLTSATCTTGTNGTCTISTGNMPKSPTGFFPISFTVVTVSGETLLYDAKQNTKTTLLIYQP